MGEIARLINKNTYENVLINGPSFEGPVVTLPN